MQMAAKQGIEIQTGLVFWKKVPKTLALMALAVEIGYEGLV